MEEKVKQISELLKVLSNENRMMIICILIEKPMIVGEIAKQIPAITLSALSQHLSILKAHGILDSKKSAQNITYFISDKRVEELVQTMKKIYCN